MEESMLGRVRVEYQPKSITMGFNKVTLPSSIYTKILIKDVRNNTINILRKKGHFATEFKMASRKD